MNRTTRHAVLLGGFLATATATAAAAGWRDHAPADDSAVTTRGGTVAIDVLANDPGVTGRTALRMQAHPAHGSVLVADGKLVYTPAPGYSGRDTLRYSIKTQRVFGIATVTIDVGDALTLSGGVTDGGSNAGVTATVGPHRFQGKAAADGSYTLDVIGRDGDMVALESASGPVALLSIVGGFTRLRQEAGTDGVLVRGENNQVQVTRLSAALAYLLQLANGGDPLASEAELDAAHGALDTNVLLQMAAAIKLVADGDYALPKGVPDTLALISDTDAYQQFIGEVSTADPQALEDAIAATMADPDVVPASSEAAMVGARSIMYGGADGSVRVGVVHGERVRLLAGGVGSYAATDAAADDGVSWTFAAGAAQVILDVPRQGEYIVYVGGVPVRAIDTFERLDIATLVDGGASGRDLVGVRRYRHVSYPDNPELPDQFYSGTITALSHRDGVAEVPFQASEFPAIRALQVHRPEIFGDGASNEPLDGSNYALHQFNAGGAGQLLDDGQAFTWSLDAEGRVAVAYADGETALLRRLLQDDGKGDGVMAEYLLPGGRTKALYTLSSVRDGSLVFDAANVARPWRSGFDISQTAYDFGDDYGFYIVLDGPGQTGSQVFVDAAGIQAQPLSWLLPGGTMVARHYRDAAGWQPECTLGVNGCYIQRERRWVPVSRSGDRIYVHEELLQDPDASGPLPPALLSQRANFYQVEAPPAP